MTQRFWLTVLTVWPVLCFWNTKLHVDNEDNFSTAKQFRYSKQPQQNSFSLLNTVQAISWLQLVQNTAARLLTRSTKRDHITPILASLHWLPSHFRINFKNLLIVYKSHHGLPPTYISDLLSPYSTPRPLRSTHHGMLALPRGQGFFCSSSLALE